MVPTQRTKVKQKKITRVERNPTFANLFHNELMNLKLLVQEGEKAIRDTVRPKCKPSFPVTQVSGIGDPHDRVLKK